MSVSEIQERIRLARLRIESLQVKIAEIQLIKSLELAENDLLAKEDVLIKELSALEGGSGNPSQVEVPILDNKVPKTIPVDSTIVPLKVYIEVPEEKTVKEAPPKVESSNKGTEVKVTQGDYNWGLLSNTIPTKFPFYKDTLEVLGQFNTGTYDYLVSNNNAPAYASTYVELLTHIQDTLPKGSIVNPLVHYVRLNSNDVANILGVTELAVQQLILSGELLGIKHTHSSYSIFSGDVIQYILTNLAEKDPNEYLKYMRIIPHLFPYAVYTALKDDHNFAKLETNCMFGFNLISTTEEVNISGLSEHKWNKAHLKLKHFEPTIAQWMESTGKGRDFGTSSVRSWFKTYYPNLLEGLLARHEKYSSIFSNEKSKNLNNSRRDYLGLAYVEFLLEYSRYYKKTNQLLKPFADGYDPKVVFLTTEEYLTPTELGRVTGTSNELVNTALKDLGYQSTKEVKGGKQWVPADIVVDLIKPHDIDKLYNKKDIGSCFTLHWKAEDTTEILRKYFSTKKSLQSTP